MTGYDIDRRTLVLAALAAGVQGCSGHVKPSPIPAGGAAVNSIDIHCHVFNVRDLPAKGFIDDIYISASPGVKRYAEQAVVALLVAVMDVPAVGATQEANRLNGGGGAVAFADQFSDDYSPERNAELLRFNVARATSRLQGEIDAHPPVPGGLVTPEAAAENSRLQSLQEIFRDLARAGSTPGSAAFATAKPSAAAVADGAARAFSLKNALSDLAGLLWMATLLTRPRYELTKRLLALPSHGSSEVRFLVPAIIDYSYWLNDHSSSPLAQQVNVMSAIAAHPPKGYAIHGWVSFCPWRQLVEPGQISVIKDAILNRGLLGIKMYPVMGFYPIGNEAAQKRGEVYPCALASIADFGKRMDDALREIYGFCVANQVPLMAHCSHSQFPYSYDCSGKLIKSADVGLRGAPDGWEAVLREYPTLRLNFGHAGGLWDLGHRPSNPVPAPPWIAKVFEIIANPAYPNAFADFSDYATIFDRDQKENDYILAGARTYLAKYPAAADKLMYGTDWVMLAQSLGADEYYPAMKTVLGKGLGLNARQVEGFLGANAARFAGLSISNGVKMKARERLEVFYEANKLDKGVLAVFD